MRTTFSIDSTYEKITRVSVFLSGLGYSELHINGHKIRIFNKHQKDNDVVLNPGWTYYPYRSLYSMYSIDPSLLNLDNENAIGVVLGK